MELLLVLAGALVVFLAGWAMGRSTSHQEIEPRPTGRAQQAVSVAEVLDGHPTGVVVGDRTGRVAFRNAAARRLEGTHAGVLLDEAIELHHETARRGVISRETIEFYGPPKQVFDVAAHPLPDGGGVVFIDDISERRRIDQVRTDFVANISHELKTPIGALAVLAETLVGEDDPATVDRIVQRMLAEADRASETIEDLMELTRIEAGGDQLVELVKVSDILRGAIGRVTELAARHQISISTLEPVDQGAQRSAALAVMGDRRQLVSAVGNLVENAVKYSDPGSSVQVRARPIDGWIEITVADQGAGIPKRDLDRIFERFYRVDRARSRTTGGTGLGLSIVRHVASNHDGEVLVTSAEGEGSTFVLRLPNSATRAGQPPGSTGSSSTNQPSATERGDQDQGVA